MPQSPSSSSSSEAERDAFETPDWKLGCFLDWCPKSHSETCPNCGGRGTVGGGFKDLDGPRECSNCCGTGSISKGPTTSKPELPKALVEHMRRAWWDFHNPQTKAATPPSLPIDFKQASELTDEQITEIARVAHAEGRLSWLGFQKDADGRYTVPQLSQSDYQLVRAVLKAVPSAAPKQASEQGEEDAYVIQRLGNLLAGVAIALKGDELPLHRHSYHDLEDVARTLKLELDLYRALFPNGVPESAAAAVSNCGISDEQLWSAYLTILNWVEYVGKEEAIAKARAALSPSPHPEEGALLLGGDEGGKKGGEQ